VHVVAIVCDLSVFSTDVFDAQDREKSRGQDCE